MASIAELAHGENRVAYSINHSPSSWELKCLSYLLSVIIRVKIVQQNTDFKKYYRATQKDFTNRRKQKLVIQNSPFEYLAVSEESRDSLFYERVSQWLAQAEEERWTREHT